MKMWLPVGGSGGNEMTGLSVNAVIRKMWKENLFYGK